ncbi:hypothetical protein ABE28_003290 [Peribacillus muralis]|uniref:Uncharacterized protein n=1 Tax=Peribacillus muralis TaxID=264697 RepID=A0A1B3XJG0_9BACI|nr:hypothetical protein [Peribacillus muralis]AOH53364.1 hypothetical protein ABE28_003290 [Peribacillus muralis]
MTIALSIKINDGIVLAADSATTITEYHNGQELKRVYNNANKVLQLHKEIPAGLITWGNGSIGKESIATIVKNYRELISTGEDKIDKNHYTLEDLANTFHSFILEKYKNEYSHLKGNGPYTGFTISGYSANASYAEEWRVELNGMIENQPFLLSSQDHTGMKWAGQPEAISRLVNGYSMQLQSVLLSTGIPEDQVDIIMAQVGNQISSPIINAPMPIKDAIDLADFLIDMTAKFSTYTAGDQSVGGPIEIASITKHEGFKWAKRKLYFTSDYNF